MEINENIKLQLLSRSLHEMLLKYDNKIAKCLVKLNKHGYFKDSTRNITLRKDKIMSFCPANKETILNGEEFTKMIFKYDIATNDNVNIHFSDEIKGVHFKYVPNPYAKWTKDNRQEGKYGKIIKKVLKEQVPKLKYTDKDLEELVNLLKAEVDDGEFKLVSGEDIKKYYNYRHNVPNQGSLSSSCMRDCNSNFFDIYAKNPDVVKMLITLKDDDKITGRALLWQDKWLDRIYGSDHTITRFKEYAKEKGWNFKKEQTYDNRDSWISSEGEEFVETFSIELDTDHERYPYLDTFAYMSDGTLSNDDYDYDYELCSTNGYRCEEDEAIYDEYDDCYIYEYDAVYIETRNYYTHVSNAVLDNLSGGNILSADAIELHDGRMTHENNDEIITCSNGDYALIEDTYTCEYSDDIYIEVQYPSVYLEELELTVNRDYIEDTYEEHGYIQIDGEWILESEVEEENEELIK